MMLQKVFKDSYISQLTANIKIEDYLGDEFPYDKTQVKNLANVYEPEHLLEKLDPKDDYKTAIALYDAYKDISLVVASRPNLWLYLTHVTLFSYVQKRWSQIRTASLSSEDEGYNMNDTDEIKQKKYVQNHWLQNPKFMRTTFAGLWWHVYLTIDETRSEKYELTKMLFENTDFRTLRFGELGLIRHREAMIGVLEFLIEHPEVRAKAFSYRGQAISKYFNMLGGTKPLIYMDRDFFKDRLESNMDVWLSIKTVSDVQNKVLPFK